MRSNWSDLGLGLASFFLGGAIVTVFAVRRRLLRRAQAEQQAANDKIAALTATVEILHARIAELNRREHDRLTEDENRPAESPGSESTGENFSGETADPLKPEMIAVISAAATAFLGKSARIRSAKLVPDQAPTSAWTQQGRAIVHSSHNLRGRK